MAVKTFTTGEVLTASDTNTYLANSGLVYVTSTTVGTAVATVTVSNCFSSTYDNYRIIVSGVDCSTASNGVSLKFNNSSGSTYSCTLSWRDYATGTTSGTFRSASSDGLVIGLSGGNDDTFITLDVGQPFAAKYTPVRYDGAATDYNYWGGGVDKNAASQTGFTLGLVSGGVTFTGGVITVMGYRKA